jgi:polyphosphate glucokinase
VSGVALGVDVGGSSIKFAPVNTRTGRCIGELRSVATPQPASDGALLVALAALSAEVPPPAPMGVALPSVVRAGVVHTAANLDASLLGLPLAQELRRRLQRPAACLNDADAAGLAEVRWGAARGVRGVVMVLTFGTGIGSALFTDARLVPNTELGHLEIGGEEAEKFASARVKTIEQLDWLQWTARVNRYLDAINALFWPELIIIGGGISESFTDFSALLRSRAPVRPALLGAAAGVVGAAMAAAGQDD